MTEAAQRRAELAKIHIAKKELRLDDDSYRDLMEELTGERSAADLDGAGRRTVLEEFRRRGFRDKPAAGKRRVGGEGDRDRATISKVRALWLSLYHLGVVSERSERALDAFVKRQTGVERLAWLRGGDSNRVIEALKAWAVRPWTGDGGGVDWDEHENPRVCVARAQWRRLHSLGAARTPGPGGLDGWLQSARITPNRTSVAFIADAAADEAIRRLGDWLRKTLARVGGNLKAGQ